MAALEPLPDAYVDTREALHRVAEEVVAPARKPHNEIALTATPGGFGTPPFEFGGSRVQVRVDGPGLVLDRDGQERRTALTTLGDAAAFIGGRLFPDGPPDDEDPLAIDPHAARRLGAFYGFAADSLERFRAELPAAADASAINLWPEHFDIALEAGSESQGQRANYGASPGDEGHAEPYLYVGPWTARPQGELWNATEFTGAELSYSELLAARDPTATAVEFFAARMRALTDSS